jgi:hypothetical protein
VTHGELVDRAAKWLRGTLGCGVVLTERFSVAVETPDAIGWKYGESHLVECKVSRADFHADAKKPWRQPGMGMGCYRWYLTPVGLLTPQDIPAEWGWIEAAPRRCAVRQQATRRDRVDFGAGEVHLLVSELRRYQLHGITYPALPGRTLRVRPTEEL